MSSYRELSSRDGSISEELKQQLDKLNKVEVSATAEVRNNIGIHEFGISSPITTKINKTTTKMKLVARISNEDVELLEGIKIEYGLSVIPNGNLNNVVVTCDIPDGLSFDSATGSGTYDTSTRKVTWNFGTLNSVKSITLKGIVNNLSENTYTKDIPLTFIGKSTETGNEEIRSNKISILAYKPHFELTQTSSASNGIIKAGEEVTYIITVKNLSPVEDSIIIRDFLPSDLLTFKKLSYEQDGKTTEITKAYGTSVSTPLLTLDSEETITIYIKAVANDIDEGKDSEEVTNKVTIVTGSGNTTVYDNESSITHKVIKDENSGGGNQGGNGSGDGSGSGNNGGNGNDNNGTYTISGTAWLDENKDGKRDDKELLLSDIKVYLLDGNTNKVISEAKTNKNGAYTFKDIKVGNYIVAFEYDNLKYDLSLYQAEGVGSEVNSDVVNMELTLNGQTKKYAVTDSIRLNSNNYNLDIGLIDSPKFQLELSKGISLVQVSNKQGTKNYNFDNKDSAKIEIAEKYMEGSVIAITYTIKVSNTGAVPGYVNKVVDYKAKDLSFSSSLNPEWYQDTDGNLYNTSLVGQEIKPGESRELSLILTKTMTSGNIGVSNNTAEIAEASNDLGIEDISSVYRK